MSKIFLYRYLQSHILNHQVIIRGPMLRYIFLSVMALLLLSACGGNDLAKLNETNRCPKCDLRGADLTGANLSGANLSGANLSGANLTKADLQWADLSEANLVGAYLIDAYLIDANLAGANLTGADLDRADLQGAKLVGGKQEGAILDCVIGADFANALNVPDINCD